MIVEETIGQSAINNNCNVGKDIDVDVDEEGRRTLMVVVVVVTQHHRGDDHHKEVVSTNNFHEEEGIAVVCLSDDRCILFLVCDQAEAVYHTFLFYEMRLLIHLLSLTLLFEAFVLS